MKITAGSKLFVLAILAGVTDVTARVRGRDRREIEREIDRDRDLQIDVTGRVRGRNGREIERDIDHDRNLQQWQAMVVIGNTYPLSLCQGDCDRDSDCNEGLRCFHRPPGGEVPFCKGGADYDAKTDFCVPEGAPDSLILDLAIEGNNGSGEFPYGECRGDCDNDSECQPGLVCFQRGPGQPVPGCRGGDYDGSRTDYCINPANLNSGPGNNLANTYRIPLVVTIDYQISTNDRAPTDAEYSGVLDQTDKWLTDSMDSVWDQNGDAFLRVDTSIQSKDYDSIEPEWTHTIIYGAVAFFKGNSLGGVPGNVDVLLAITDGRFNTQTYVRGYLRNAAPDTSVFRRTMNIRIKASSAGPTTQV